MLFPPDQRREDLEKQWLRLTRQSLPSAASNRSWPISADHCFQRVLLDNACGGVWYDAIDGRPAYRHASEQQLRKAISLARAVLTGTLDLETLNRKSLCWRR